MPSVSARAAAALTLRSPLSFVFDVQAERSPASKPSAKISSGTNGVFVGVGVSVGVGEGPGVAVSVGVAVGGPLMLIS